MPESHADPHLRPPGAAATAPPPSAGGGELSGAQSEFLASMSHEIRTPINAIVGYTELMEIGLGGPLTDVQRGHLERIRESGRHLLALVDEVLDLARLEAGRAHVEREPRAAGVAVDAALHLVRPQAMARGLALSGACEGDPAARYLGDENRARQVVVNLLSNAVKFTHPGGRVRVLCGTAARADDQVASAHPGPWTWIRVEDTGIGIAPEKLERIFDPFVQAERELTRSYGGTGLGLTISRRLARRMGGDLTVRSRPGEGAAFTLWLPAAGRDAGAEPPAPAGAQPQARPSGVAAVGHRMLRGTEELAAEFARRLRTEIRIPAVGAATDSMLKDHTATFLSDAAQSIVLLEESPEDASDLVRDGSSIQRMIADRHGLQRSRIGWTEEALHAEFAALRALLEERVPALAAECPGADAAEALRLLFGFLQQYAEVSLRSFRIALRSASRE